MVALLPDRHAHVTAVLALCCGALALAFNSNITAWLHSLLSDSSRHPLPEGLQCSYGVVLGYALHRNGSCTRPLQSRVEVGVQAFQQDLALKLIFSGAHPGNALRNVTEANAMAAYAKTLVQHSPPPGSWILEEASTSTRTNALYSLAVIAERQQQQQQQPQQQQDDSGQKHQQQAPTVLLVTSPFHQFRSYLTFKRAAQQSGLDIQLFTAKAPFAGHCGYGHWLLDTAMDQLDFWRELAAIAWYGLRGWL